MRSLNGSFFIYGKSGIQVSYSFIHFYYFKALRGRKENFYVSDYSCYGKGNKGSRHAARKEQRI